MATRSRRHDLALLGVLLLGVTLRLVQPTLVPFKRDEATIARLGQAIAHEGYRPAAGVGSSLGVENLPLTLYLMALPLRLWPDPLFAVIFTILLNSLALPACYLLGRALLGRRSALLATLLFAVSPWAVLYARKIWARTLPLFTIALISSLWLAVVRKKWWAVVASFAALAALLGLQLEAVAFVPIVGVVLLRYHRQLDARALLAGVLVFVMLLAPYVVHDARQGWQNARGLLEYAQAGGAFSWDAVGYTFSLLGSQGIEGQAGSLFQEFRDALPPLWWLNHVLSALFVGSLVLGLHQAFRAPTAERRRTFGLLLLWIAVPVALQMRPARPTQQHYFVMHYPAQYLLIAALLTKVGEWIRGGGWRLTLHRFLGDAVTGKRAVKAVQGGFAVALIIACGWQVLVTSHLRATMVARPSTGGYGVPLRYRRQAAQEARRLAAGGEIIVLGRETKPFATETPTVFDALLFGTPHRFADGRVVLPLPERGRAVYLVTPELEPQSTVLEERMVGTPGLASGPRVSLDDGPSYRIYWLQEGHGAGVIEEMVALNDGVPFANGVVFAAAEAPGVARAGDSIEVCLAWWVRGAPDGGPYHFTVQLLDGDGRLRSQDDHAGFPSQSWQAGDVVLSRFRLVVPSDLRAAAYRLRAGMYRYPGIEPVPVVDPQGAPVDDGVDLGRLRVVVDG